MLITCFNFGLFFIYILIIKIFELINLRALANVNLEISIFRLFFNINLISFNFDRNIFNSKLLKNFKDSTLN